MEILMLDEDEYKIAHELYGKALSFRLILAKKDLGNYSIIIIS